MIFLCKNHTKYRFPTRPCTRVSARPFAANNARIWLGTDENVGGRHVGFADGVYRSDNAGKKWKSRGLKNSERISKIIVHADDYDGNGMIDPIVTAYLGDVAYPVHPRNTLGRQLPGRKREFPDYATTGGGPMPAFRRWLRSPYAPFPAFHRAGGSPAGCRRRHAHGWPTGDAGGTE